MSESRGAASVTLDTIIERMRPFLDYHRKVETAPRWVCPECQFESNRFHASHAPGCSHREAKS